MKNKLLLCLLFLKAQCLIAIAPIPSAPPAPSEFFEPAIAPMPPAPPPPFAPHAGTQATISALDRQEDRLAREEIELNKKKKKLDQQEKQLKKKEEAQEKTELTELQKFAVKAGIEVALIPIKAACHEYPLETFGASVVSCGFAYRYFDALRDHFHTKGFKSLMASSVTTPGGLRWVATTVGTIYTLNQFKKWYQGKPRKKRNCCMLDDGSCRLCHS